MKGSVVFQDAKLKKTKVSISGITDLAALTTLVTALDPKSNAQIIQYSVSDELAFAGGATGTGEFKSVEEKLLLTFRYFDDDNDKHYVKLGLPCPADSVVEWVEKVGWRALNAEGTSIAVLLSAATGRTYEYTRGTMVGRPTESQT